MARTVDLSQPLEEMDEADLRYAAQRGMFNEEDDARAHRILEGGETESSEVEEVDDDGLTDSEREADANAEASRYDPGEYTVRQVKEAIDEDPELATSILLAEQAGQNRSGIVNYALAATESE